MNKRFPNVVKNHDEFIHLLKNEIFPQYGLLVQHLGYEKIMNQNFQNRLKGCYSETAFYLRFNPDLGIISPTDFVALVDGKTKAPWQTSPNLSIELNPWEKAKQLMKNENINIFYAFQNFKACWVNQIIPNEIIVPDRWTANIFWEVRSKYMNCCSVKYRPWKKGQSGTIYLLLYPKTINSFPDLDLFIENELLKNAKT